jgi:hypothetical protein
MLSPHKDHAQITSYAKMRTRIPLGYMHFSYFPSKTLPNLTPRRFLRSISPATNTLDPSLISIPLPLLFPSPRPLLTLSPTLPTRVPPWRDVMHAIIPPADIMPARIRIRRRRRMTVRKRGRQILRRRHRGRRILPRCDIAVALVIELMA